MLVQPTQDEGASSERLSDEQPSPSPAPTSEVPNESLPDSSSAQPSEVPIEHQPVPSPRPSPTATIPDSIPEPTGENLGDHSSNDTSLSGNEDEMTLQNVYDLCISLCQQVSDQAKEIKLLKAKIKKLKKQAKPVIKHHKAYLKTVSLQQRFPRKSFSKKHRVHKESVSKQGRKKAKEESSFPPNLDLMAFIPQHHIGVVFDRSLLPFCVCNGLEVCYIDVSWPYDGSIDDLEVFGRRLEVLGTCGELDALVSIPDEGDMAFLRKKVKSGAAVGKLVLLQVIVQ
ncbi:hypothetical protein Tco_1266089 [Tanacetum coccineum]